jgi:hypothetical protein
MSGGSRFAASAPQRKCFLSWEKQYTASIATRGRQLRHPVRKTNARTEPGQGNASGRPSVMIDPCVVFKLSQARDGFDKPTQRHYSVYRGVTQRLLSFIGYVEWRGGALGTILTRDAVLQFQVEEQAVEFIVISRIVV